MPLRGGIAAYNPVVYRIGDRMLCQLKLLTYAYWRDPGTMYISAWIRLGRWGQGLYVLSKPPMFSERNGYMKPFLTVARYRIFYLKRLKPG
jgi:hypothetical protein